MRDIFLGSSTFLLQGIFPTQGSNMGLLHCKQILCHLSHQGNTVQSLVTQSWLTATSWTLAHQAPLSMEFSRQECCSGLPCLPPGDLPNPGIEPSSPTLQADSLPSEPPGKPKNTGVGSLSLLQGNFLTRELNQGLLHCGWILYQLSYQGSLENTIEEDKCKCSPGRLYPFC